MSDEIEPCVECEMSSQTSKCFSCWEPLCRDCYADHQYEHDWDNLPGDSI